MPRAVTIGVFDGLHIGHRSLIARLLEEGKKAQLIPLVVTFSVHPAAILSPPSPPLVTTLEEKLILLEALGVPEVLVLDFTEELSKTSYWDFCQDILVARLRTRVLVVGPDFALGHQRAGTVQRLKEAGEALGFQLVTVAPVIGSQGPVSSSLIRRWLQSGEWEKAFSSLGGFYLIGGPVTKGAGRGSQMGFPTVNIQSPQNKLLPPHGVYAGWLKSRQQSWQAAAYVGLQPTFGGHKPVVEAYLLGFFGNFAPGDTVTLFLTHFLRPDKKFETVEELIAQMTRDVEKAREVLKDSPLE